MSCFSRLVTMGTLEAARVLAILVLMIYWAFTTRNVSEGKGLPRLQQQSLADAF